MDCLKERTPWEQRGGFWLKRDDLWGMSPDRPPAGSNARRIAIALMAFRNEIVEEHSGCVWIKPKTPKDILDVGIASKIVEVKAMAVLTKSQFERKAFKNALGESGVQPVQTTGMAMDAWQAIRESWKLHVVDSMWQAENAPEIDILIVPCGNGILASGAILAIENGARIGKVIAVQTDGLNGKAAIQRIIGEQDIDRIGETRCLPEWRVELCREWRKTKKVQKDIDGIPLNPLREAKVLVYAEKWLKDEMEGRSVGLWLC